MESVKKVLFDKIGYKGQGSISSFFAFIMGLILLAALLPVANSLVGTIVAGNMNSLSNSDVIQLLVGMTGVLMVILFFMGVISDFQTRNSYTQ